VNYHRNISSPYLLSSLGMREDFPPLPHESFIARYLVKQRDNFTFTLPLK
jgi:hypothetical protein